MTQLYFHKTTQAQIVSYRDALPHGLLISGQPGVGHLTVAHQLTADSSADILLLQPHKNDEINRQEGIIGVDMIRRLYSTSRLQRSGRGQVVILRDAETMTTSAQNAFLKLLEEPRNGYHFILLTSASHRLLATVRSRLQTLHVQPISEADSRALIQSHGVTDPTTVSQLLYAAQGKPAELTRLLATDDGLADYSETISQAKTFLTGTLYDKCKIIQMINTDRNHAQLLLERLLQLQRTILLKDASKTRSQQIEACLEAMTHLKANAHVKTTLLSVALNS